MEPPAHARIAAVHLYPQPSFELSRLESLAELLFFYGPLVELSPPSMLFVEIGRSREALRKALGGERSEERVAEHIVRTFAKAGQKVCVAVAKDPDTARTLASMKGRECKGSKRSPIWIVPPGDESLVLSKLPIDALVWTDLRDDPDRARYERLRTVCASLRMLGVHDVARIRSLPSSQIASRFGDAGALLMERAWGGGERPLRPFSPPDRLIEEHEIDGREEDLEPVLFILKRLFSRLEARLEARRLVLTEINLRFVIEPGLERSIDFDDLRPARSKRMVEMEISLARPSRRASTMLALAREKLGGSLPGAVSAIAIEAKSTSRDRGTQLDLFTMREKKVEEVGELIGRLKAALGDDAVFSPEICDSHRPERAWRARVFEIERALEESPSGSAPRDRVSKAKNEILERRTAREVYVLPEVSGELSVVGDPNSAGAPRRDDVEARSIEEICARMRSWPKPIQRKKEDEPVPALPPRPLELLDTPEKVTFARDARTSSEIGILFWREERLPVIDLGGSERLEAEWWTRSPLSREYFVAEVNDGRKFWLFSDLSGDIFVHGVFD